MRKILKNFSRKAGNHCAFAAKVTLPGKLLKEIGEGKSSHFNLAGTITAKIARDEERVYKDILTHLETR